MVDQVTMAEISSDRLLDSLFDGLYCVDRNMRITYWSRAAQRVTGFARDEVLGSFCAANILRHVEPGGKELCGGDCPLACTLQDGKVRVESALLHHKHGFRVPVQIRTSPVFDDAGAIIGAVELFTDNSNALQLLEEFENLKKDVYIDRLTGVANRRFAEMTLESALHDWRVHAVPFGVLFYDIDNFKSVNDHFGHQIGDEVLLMVARTAANVLRKFDTAARWGGEEFLAILQGANQETLSLVAERIRTLLEQSFIMIGPESLSVTVSIGGSLVAVGDTEKSILARADSQMYLSKKNGRNRVSIHQLPTLYDLVLGDQGLELPLGAHI
jgi:diguanylate cyclase (GGDEF)-like protein/PAS domain S-box-containing protein